MIYKCPKCGKETHDFFKMENDNTIAVHVCWKCKSLWAIEPYIESYLTKKQSTAKKQGGE